MHDRQTIHRVATMYYVQDQTMDAIAAQLRLSRSTVSRMLKTARELGLVTISVASDPGSESPLAQAISSAFGVQTHVVPCRSSASSVQRLDQVARVAAQLVSSLVHDDQVVGLAWGTTLSAVIPYLPPRPTRGTSIVQLNGAANQVSSGVTYAGELLNSAAAAFDAEVTYFPTPAFFDYADTKAALWRETSLRRVLDLQRRCDLAVFGVGALQGEVSSQVYVGGYLDDTDLATLRSTGVVGDVCTVFVREDGTWADIELNHRTSGPTPGDLATIPRRVCIASGRSKVPALVGALRAGAITDVVIDEPSAALLVDRLRGRSGRGERVRRARA